MEMVRGGLHRNISPRDELLATEKVSRSPRSMLECYSSATSLPSLPPSLSHAATYLLKGMHVLSLEHENNAKSSLSWLALLELCSGHDDWELDSHSFSPRASSFLAIILV